MARGKSKSDPKDLSDRFEHSYREELACNLWAQRMAVRDQAMAQPVRGFVMPDEKATGHGLPEAAIDFTPG